MEDVANTYATLKTNSLERVPYQTQNSVPKPDSTVTKFVTSSVSSSGYWEDCDSLGTSEYDISGSSTGHDLHVGSTTSWQTEIRSAVSLPNENGLMIEGRTKPGDNVLDHSTKLRGRYLSQQTGNNLDGTLKSNRNSTFGLNRPGSALNRQETIPKTSTTNSSRTYPTKTNKPSRLESLNSFEWDTPIKPQPELFRPRKSTPIKSRKKRFVHLSFSPDDSSSDDEDDNEDEYGHMIGEGGRTKPVGEPKTKFEAALRKAELENSQRQQALNSDRLMPDWGSPIQIRSNNKTKRVNPVAQSIDPEVYLRDSETDKEFSECPRKLKTIDLCMEMEEWLKSRPAHLYNRKSTDYPILQIFFLNDSQQDLTIPLADSQELVDQPAPPMIPPENPSPETNVDPISIDQTSSDSPLTDKHVDLNKEPTPNPTVTSTTVNPNTDESSESKQQCHLLAALTMPDNLIHLFKETGTYYMRLLEFCRRDCSTTQSVAHLQHTIQKHKSFEKESELALEQVPKMARMQLEVERLRIPSITPSMAKLLKLDNKKSFRVDALILDHFNISQLQVIANDMLKTISVLNATLMEQLMERDELHLEQGGKITDMEDIRSWIRDLSIRAQNPIVRRQLLHNLLAASAIYPTQPVNTKSNYQHQYSDRSVNTKSKWVMALFRHKSIIPTLS